MNTICAIAFLGTGILAVGAIITVALLFDKPFIYLYEKFDEVMENVIT